MGKHTPPEARRPRKREKNEEEATYLTTKEESYARQYAGVYWCF